MLIAFHMPYGARVFRRQSRRTRAALGGALAGEAERTWAARAQRIQTLLARVRGGREG